MMKRMFMLMSLALMIGAAMALSGVAQAKSNSASPDAKCAKQASAKLGKGFDPSGYTFVGGTAGDDNFDGKATAGPDVFCGFDGANSIYTLDAGDIFLGGDGTDSVTTNNGTFNGGLGVDSVGTNNGTFNGQADNDSVSFQNYGTFNGGLGVDSVIGNQEGSTFNGEADDDYVSGNAGTYNGGAGDDHLEYNTGTFDGGAGTDTFGTNDGGTLVNVP